MGHIFSSILRRLKKLKNKICPICTSPNIIDITGESTVSGIKWKCKLCNHEWLESFLEGVDQY